MRIVVGALLALSLSWCAVAQTVRPMVGHLKGVVAGEHEDLWRIAYSHRLAVEHLAFANGLPITMMQAPADRRLVIPNWRILPANPPRNGLVVNLPERGVFLFKNGHFKNFYPLSIGDEVLQNNRFWTRTGSATIAEKQKNPTWYPPAWAKDRRPVGPGPDNPLGDRWIGLSMPRVGIHGTSDPLNVGNSVTHGCMRTYPELVRELYDEVQVGWPVRIEYEVAKVGRGPDGKLYVVTFPDVYRKKDPVVAAMNLLRKLKVTNRVGRRNFKDVLALNLGFPVSLEGKDPVLTEVARQVHWALPQEAGAR